MPEKAQPRLGIPLPWQELLGYKCIRRADYYRKVYPSTVSKGPHVPPADRIKDSGIRLFPKGLEPVSSLPGSEGQVRVGNPSPCPAEALSSIYDANPHSARGELQMNLFLHTGHLKLKILPGFLLDDPS